MTAPSVDILTKYAREYGPLSFGVLSFLLLWFVVVKPELAASREVAKDQTSAIHSMERAVEKLEETSRRLDRVSSRLEAPK